MLYVQQFLFLSALILNKNILLFSLFERYYLHYIENIVCLIFHDSSSLLLLLYVNVIHWGFPPPRGGTFGILIYTGKKQIIRLSFQYLIYALMKYLLMQLIIIPGLDHFIGQIIHCLIQVVAPACTSNWHRQQWRERVWWGGIRHISEVTLYHLHVGLWSRAPPMGGYDNSHTRPLRNTTPRWHGIIMCPDFRNGRECLMYVLQGRFETGYHWLVSWIGNRSMWDL